MLKSGPLIPFAALIFVGCGDAGDPAGSVSPAAAGSMVDDDPDGGRSPDPFVDISESCGVVFDHVAGADGQWVLTEIMGGGGALFDLEGDGDLDLLLLGGAARSGDPTSPPSGLGHGLFRNDGQGQFEDISAAAGLDHLTGYAMGAACGDVNADGIVDLFVTQLGRNALLFGDGSGHFQDVSEAWGVDTLDWSTSATFVDFDADGDLDLFVARYIELNAKLECRDSTGRRTYCPPASGPAVHDLLFRNDGASFTDVTQEAGFDGAAQPGLGVVAGDITGNGGLDLYVTNDGQPNQLWVRLEDGSWRDEAMQRGAALNHNGAAEASMGIVAEDLDGDGQTDLFMTHLQEETHTLYTARAAGNYSDRTSTAGLNRITRPSTGFGVAALDLELDGDLDLAVAQGRVRIGKVHPGCELVGAFAQLAEPNLLLVNRGSGQFARLPGGSSALESPIAVDRSVLAGDIDGDGDIDLVFTRNDSPVQVLRNDAARMGGWIVIDPRVSASAATALGVRVSVSGGEHEAVRESRASDGYQSSRDPRVHFGLPGEPESADVEIRWADGQREHFPACASGQVHRLLKGTGRAL